MFRTFLILFSFNIVTFPCFGQLQVNEVCASNSTTIADETGAFEDWIELYNPTDSPINMQGWRIGTTPILSESTVLFPNAPQFLAPQGFRLVWCDAQPQDGPAHLPFKLNNAGEELFLFDPNENLISNTPVPFHLNDHSWGMDAEANWRNFMIPTPLEINSTSSFFGTLNKPTPNYPSGIYNFDLENIWTHEQTDVLITFTLNGAAPEESDEAYSSPISLTESTIVTARAFKDGFIPSQPTTFHFLNEEVSSLPVISIAADFYDLFGFFGILNAWDSGEEIDASYTYIYSNIQNYSSACGLELHASTPSNQQALRLTAKSVYNEPSFTYPFFSTEGATDHNALILRIGGDDAIEQGGTLIRDKIIHQAFDEIQPEHTSADAQSVAVYLNGQYWGIYQLRERQDSAFIHHHYNETNFDLLERSAEYVSTRNAIAGNWSDFDLLEQTAIDLDLAQNENLNFISEWMNLDNFTDYQLTEIFISNQDWLSNNMKFWRPTDESRPWQWLLWDTDWGLGRWGTTYAVGSPEWNALEFALSDWGGWLEDEIETELLQNLIANEAFKTQFISRAADLRNTAFETYRWNQRIDSTLSELATELPRHFERWELDFQEWEAELDTLRNFIELRPAIFMEHFKDVFELDDIHDISLNSFPPETGTFEVNSLTLDSAEWSGDYFQAIPVRIKALPPPGFELTGWSDLASTEMERLIQLSTDTNIVALYTPVENLSDLVLNEIMYAPNNNSSDWVELYNPGESTSELLGYTLSTSTFEITFEDSLAIPAGDYLIVAKDSTAFLASYPLFTGLIVAEEDLDLGATTTTLKLISPFAVTEDSVRYSLTSPWPFLANGTGASLELIIGSTDNSLGINWFADANGNGSPGAENTPPPVGVAEDYLFSLSVAPNPLTNHFTLYVPKTLQGMSFVLYSAQGKKVHSGVLGMAGHQQIDCSSLASGSYYLSIQGEKGSINQLILKR